MVIKLIAYGAYTLDSLPTSNTGILQECPLLVWRRRSRDIDSSQYLTELSGAEAVGGRDDPPLVDQGAAALDHLH